MAPVTADAGGARRKSVPSVGAHFHGLRGYEDHDERRRALTRLAAGGLEWIRVDLPWRRLQRSGPDRFNGKLMARTEKIVRMARARGIKVLGTFYGSPSWARPDGLEVGPPANVDDYGRAIRRMAHRFRGRISAWEIWNEPNHPDYWDGSVGDYAELLEAAYPKVKAGDPNAKVVSGGTSFNDYHYVRQLYEAGAKGSFDVLATNAYLAPADAPPEKADDGNVWTIKAVRRVRAVQRDFADRRTKIWFTEFGWSSHENDGTEENWQKGVTLSQQADYARRALRLIACRFRYVKRAFWYTDRNHDLAPGADKGEIQRGNYGLLTYGLNPKPVHRTLDRVIERGRVRCG